MAQQDITGLLTGIFAGDEAAQTQKLLSQKAVANNPNLLASTQTQIGRAPEQLARMRQNVGGMFGQDMRSAGEKVQEQLQGLDVTTPMGQRQAVELVSQIDRAKALALQLQFEEKARVNDLEERDTRAAEFKAASGTAGSPFQFGSSKTYKDSEGNLFLGTQRRDPTSGEVVSKLSPVGNAPSEPEGDIEEVGAYGETASEALDRDVAEQERGASAIKFVERKDVAKDDFVSSQESILKSDKMLGLLDTISTGGYAAVSAAALTDALGVTPQSVGEFENLAKQQMVAMLGVFGSNPTEGERKAAADLVASINKTKGVNRQIIQNFKNEMMRRASRAQYLLTPMATSAGFDGYLLSQYADQAKTGKVRNFKDLL